MGTGCASQPDTLRQVFSYLDDHRAIVAGQRALHPERGPGATVYSDTVSVERE
jgi:hypothetical protein